MPKNGLAARVNKEIKSKMLAARIYETHFCCDMMVIALGRLGYGEKRLAEFDKVFSEAYEEYDKLRAEDGSDDKEGTYFKACLDRELKQYTGKLFTPYEERYHWRKK